MKRLTSVVFIAMMVLLITSCNTEKVQLAYNLEKGKTYFVNVDVDQTLHQNMMQQNFDMNTKIKAGSNYEVTDKKDGIYHMNINYTGFDVSLSSPQGKMEFGSSSSDTTNPFSKIMRAMEDVNFQLEMSEQGEYVAVKGIDKMFDKMLAAIPEKDSTQNEQLKKSLKNIVGKESFKGNFGMGMPFYPDKELKKGDTWTHTEELKSISLGKVTTTWEVIEINDKVVKLKGSGNFVSEADSASAALTGIPMKFDMKGPVTSQINVDRKTGWVLFGIIDQEISGTVSMEGNEKLPQGVQLDMTIKSKIQLEGGAK